MPDALKAWEQLVAEVNGRIIFGMPGVRDPDSPCEAFAPGDPDGDCETDGHYMCDECTLRDTCEGCGRRTVHCECHWKGPPRVREA